MNKINKFLVITTIFKPTKAIKKFSKILKDWKIVIVADNKTPSNWSLKEKNVIFLSKDDQKKLPFKIIKKLPWNNYARKNIGYLYSISNNADIIAETDDDNIPYSFWKKSVESELLKDNRSEFLIDSSEKYINVYKFFTKRNIWPRGYPLDLLGRENIFSEKKTKYKIGIYQYLADSDPDVDAIYRLTINRRVKFDKNKKIVLNQNVFSPFNSQNTVFIKEVFPLMYLPSFVSIRATDIYRGYIAQRLLWEKNLYLAFLSPTVYQERNIHDYLKDFELEIPVYLNVKRIVEVLSSIKFKSNDYYKMLIYTYEELNRFGIIPDTEIELLKLWIGDIINYL